MPDIDWYDIKFLESGSNLKPLIKNAVGRTPSTKVANEVAVCIQQGRLFFEAAASSPLQIRPLLIYYGVLGFSKAVVVTRTATSIDDLVQSHGLSDVSAHNAKLEDLRLSVGQKGTFQQFNDAVASLGRIWYFDRSATPKWISKPFGEANRLAGRELPILEILSRIPELNELYERTFKQPSRVLIVGLDYWAEYGEYARLRVDDPSLFADRASLTQLVKNWRERFPFLQKWRLVEASHAWGKSVLSFANVDNQFDEFSPTYLTEADGSFEAPNKPMRNLSHVRIPFADILPPLSGGITRSTMTCAIQPHEGVNLSEFSLYFLGSYLLSSLVRYRPQTWQRAISRSFSSQESADDRSLALVEKFLDLIYIHFPAMVVNCIDYSRTR
jgi:hypothetical protein